MFDLGYLLQSGRDLYQINSSRTLSEFITTVQTPRRMTHAQTILHLTDLWQHCVSDSILNVVYLSLAENGKAQMCLTDADDVMI